MAQIWDGSNIVDVEPFEKEFITRFHGEPRFRAYWMRAYKAYKFFRNEGMRVAYFHTNADDPQDFSFINELAKIHRAEADSVSQLHDEENTIKATFYRANPMEPMAEWFEHCADLFEQYIFQEEVTDEYLRRKEECVEDQERLDALNEEFAQILSDNGDKESAEFLRKQLSTNQTEPLTETISSVSVGELIKRAKESGEEFPADGDAAAYAEYVEKRLKEFSEAAVIENTRVEEE